jgi:hypothetical protein
LFKINQLNLKKTLNYLFNIALLPKGIIFAECKYSQGNGIVIRIKVNAFVFNNTVSFFYVNMKIFMNAKRSFKNNARYNELEKNDAPDEVGCDWRDAYRSNFNIDIHKLR